MYGVWEGGERCAFKGCALSTEYSKRGINPRCSITSLHQLERTHCLYHHKKNPEKHGDWIIIERRKNRRNSQQSCALNRSGSCDSCAPASVSHSAIPMQMHNKPIHRTAIAKSESSGCYEIETYTVLYPRVLSTGRSEIIIYSTLIYR